MELHKNYNNTFSRLPVGKTKRTYVNSQKLFREVSDIIPLATQTFSKSSMFFPVNSSPLFIDSAQGSRVWDIDGNEFIDLIGALYAVVLGHNDPDVTYAVQQQLTRGTIFSLASPLEGNVARKLVEIIPCAEMVRFAKNGSDVTSAAIRLARAYTRRDHVAVCGYHGWHDWYIGSTTRSRGVPESIRKLTHVFQYNDIESLEAVFRQYPGEIAAVIMEPVSVELPQRDFLRQVRDLCTQNNVLLIFDEIITGFRLHLGGAQELFDVVPDLATFGKAMANGFPLSALVGKRHIMKCIEDIFFSMTFGGEALSLVAARTVIEKMQHNNILDHMHRVGHNLRIGLEKIINELGLSSIIRVIGYDSKSVLSFNGDANYTKNHVSTFVMQEMLQRGVLVRESHSIMYAHSDEEIDYILNAYLEVLTELRQCLSKRLLQERVREVITPVFSVRKT